MKPVIVCLLLALGALAPAWGEQVSDVLTVYNASHVIVGQVGVYEDGGIFGLNSAVFHTQGPYVGEDPWGIYYINDATLVNTRPPVTAVMDWSDPTWLSDIVGVAAGVPGAPAFVLAFGSDTETLPNQLGTDPGSPVVRENGAPIDVTSYLTLDRQAAGYTATFWSDVPEPGTTLMLGGGLLAIALYLRKRLAA
jgi:hypothetical protein